jgi:hypothetical protein
MDSQRQSYRVSTAHLGHVEEVKFQLLIALQRELYDIGVTPPHAQ